MNEIKQKIFNQLLESTSIEKLIESKVSISGVHGSVKPLEVIELYRNKFVYIANENEDMVIPASQVLEVWAKNGIKRLEVENANSEFPNIKKYFKFYGVLNKKEVYNTENERYKRKGFSSSVYYDGIPTPDERYNSKVYYKKIHFNYQWRTKGSYGSVSTSKLDINIIHREINCYIENDIPVIFTYGYDDFFKNLHNILVNHYTNENWISDLEEAFNLFSQSVANDLKEYIDIESPLLKQGSVLYQEGSKCVFKTNKLEFSSCDIITSTQYRDTNGKANNIPKRFKETTTLEKIIDEFRQEFNSCIELNDFNKI